METKPKNIHEQETVACKHTSLAVALGGNMRNMMMLLGLWFWSKSAL